MSRIRIRTPPPRGLDERRDVTVGGIVSGRHPEVLHLQSYLVGLHGHPHPRILGREHRIHPRGHPLLEHLRALGHVSEGHVGAYAEHVLPHSAFYEPGDPGDRLGYAVHLRLCVVRASPRIVHTRRHRAVCRGPYQDGHCYQCERQAPSSPALYLPRTLNHADGLAGNG